MLAREATRRKVLVVDDDRAILELITVRLTLDGFEVFTARDGRDALQRLRNVRLNAMILDLNMPVLDGFGVLEQLGKAGAARTPTLVLTARHDAADVRRAVSLGARDYLAKPFKDVQFRRRVARLFRGQPEQHSPEQAIDGIGDLLAVRAPD